MGLHLAPERWKFGQNCREEFENRVTQYMRVLSNVH